VHRYRIAEAGPWLEAEGLPPVLKSHRFNRRNATLPRRAGRSPRYSIDVLLDGCSL